MCKMPIATSRVSLAFNSARAYFYICGSKAMSKAIDAELIKIADQIGGEPYIDDFNNIIAKLVAEGRLMRDVY